MASADRETALQALYNLLNNITGFTPPLVQQPYAVGRKLVMFDQIDVSQQPCLFLVDHREKDLPLGRGLPSRVQMSLEVWVYAQAPSGTAGGTLLNNILSAIEAALKTPPGWDVQTLGGLVNRVWIEGTVLKDPGDIDSQALMRIPVQMIIP